MTTTASPPPKQPIYKRPWFLVACGAFVLLVLAGSLSQSPTSKHSPTSAPHLPSSTTGADSGGEDDLGGSGAPTTAGSVVAPGSGATPGSSACRTGDPLANVYHPNRLRVLLPCITVSGVVKTVRSEDDGDVHFDLAPDAAYAGMLTSANFSGQHGWLVVEIVPADEPGCTPGRPPRPASGSYDYGICTGADETPPAVGSHVYVTGPSVLDEDHGGWAEVHPAWAISRSAVATATTAPPATTAPAPTEAPVAVPPPGPAHTCSASMSNPTPGSSGNDTVEVTSDLPNSPVSVAKHYKTTTSYDTGTTDGGGSASITFSIGHPTAGYTVEVDVSIANGEATCSTSFTPQ